jgi:hypothetical protein
MLLSISLIELGNFRDERIIRIGIRKKGTNGKKDFRNCESRRPVVFEDVETDSTTGIDVAVIDFGGKTDLWRFERIVRRELNLKIEHTILIRSLCRTHNCSNPVEEVV